jgi:glycosyltransferase involved in cell wall biosynthesis
VKKIGIDIRKLTDYGIGTYIRTVLAAAAESKNHRFIALHKKGEDLIGLPEGIERAVEPSRLYSLGEPFSLSRSARRLGLDLLHCPHYVAPMPARTPFVVTIHDLIHLRFPQYLPGWRARQYAKFFLRRAARKARLVFSVSQFSKNDLLSEYDIDPDKVVVTHNVIDPLEYELSEEEIARRLKQIPLVPEKYVLYTGNNKPHKDLGTALRAFAGFRKRMGREWTFCFAGATFADNTEGAAMLRLVEELGIADAVVFHGFLSRPHLIALIKRARLFLFTSRYEGFGLPPLEAMAAGVPVVSSNAASLPEVLGEAALFAEPGDDLMFAANMAKLIEDNELRTEMIEKGRKNCRRFTLQNFAETLLAGYERGLSL